MSLIVQVQGDEAGRQLKILGHASYLLHGVAAVGAVLPGFEFSVFALALAFLLDVVKRADAHGTWQASHFRWRIHSVLGATVMYAVTSPLFLLLYFPGKFAWCAVSLWFVYRILRGWVNLDAGRPMPTWSSLKRSDGV